MIGWAATQMERRHRQSAQKRKSALFPVKNNERLNTAGYYKVSYEEKVRGIDAPLRLILRSQTPPETSQPQPDRLHKVFAYMHVSAHVNPLLWTCASVHVH